MDYFPDNTLASFRNFCKEEITLDGDWRVALSEINFPTKLNNVTDEEFTYFRASEVVASKSNAGNRNTISRPYYGEKVFIKSGEYTFIEQLINEIKTKLKDKIYFDAILKKSRIAWAFGWTQMKESHSQVPKYPVC